ncbi:hypothetical protein AJ85_18100 [Alkalihalobacillus alcalophilus ATCC 27647 = CGMCC 1.3604]|uniref:Uncharacterized protein n=1 Tax=Alkalihalobacillus alcalophilus ATCC 27647 = CGMCC 1.3604 TaxID=1218173 RepID=A0A4S4JW09_ALKAL|nr:hypothetical protein [Alkalihalobacillus alcalophilus]MED1562059.1 hypothetical protein [Alkalihalobacillus alcalophilus]THG89363.1 hypothetical protein AJ85_18100 [Alkalihalobacillus alcalophilus ATCC 27647 = CGMCC 1.3604]
MPIEVGVWKINDGIKKVTFLAIESERKLEDISVEDLSIVSEDLLLIEGKYKPTSGSLLICWRWMRKVISILLS